MGCISFWIASGMEGSSAPPLSPSPPPLPPSPPPPPSPSSCTLSSSIFSKAFSVTLCPSLPTDNGIETSGERDDEICWLLAASIVSNTAATDGERSLLLLLLLLVCLPGLILVSEPGGLARDGVSVELMSSFSKALSAAKNVSFPCLFLSLRSVDCCCCSEFEREGEVC